MKCEGWILAEVLIAMTILAIIGPATFELFSVHHIRTRTTTGELVAATELAEAQTAILARTTIGESAADILAFIVQQYPNLEAEIRDGQCVVSRIRDEADR